jgi:xanthine dehydrogenase molybdopterin-binding subunit B
MCEDLQCLGTGLNAIIGVRLCVPIILPTRHLYHHTVFSFSRCYTIKEAVAAGKVDPNPLTCVKGDVSEVFGRDDVKIVEGSFTFGGQSHFTMEKQTTMAVPDERGRMICYTTTQAADLSRQYTSAVLGIPGNKVEINNRRCGGGFGSKFTKNLWVLAATAVAANKLNAPIKMQNSIEVDMTMGGHSRHPFEINYKVVCVPFVSTSSFQKKIHMENAI